MNKFTHFLSMVRAGKVPKQTTFLHNPFVSFFALVCLFSLSVVAREEKKKSVSCSLCTCYCVVGLTIDNRADPPPTLLACVTSAQVIDGAKKYAVINQFLILSNPFLCCCAVLSLGWILYSWFYLQPCD